MMYQIYNGMYKYHVLEYDPWNILTVKQNKM